MAIADSSVFESWQFNKPWRPYQERVLARLDQYLVDSHFHFVAAPGSGKTVIGIEVMRRLRRGALVLVPTLAIREQWRERLEMDFLNGRPAQGLSMDLTDPGIITIATYQALSSEFKKGQGEALIARLKNAAVSALVVDEAHHLRAYWWKCLTQLKVALGSPVVISLTGTPPIDVAQVEWNRYATFCGEVDEEVGVPELVAEGNLCPHQDYIHFSKPVGQELEELERFQKQCREFLLDLELNIEFATRLGKLERWVDPVVDNKKFIRENQRFYFALAIYLQRAAGTIPKCIRECYGIHGEELPEFTLQWGEWLLQGILFDFRERLENRCEAPELLEDLNALEQKLQHLGAVEKRQVWMRSTRENDKLLRDCPAKLASIVEIIEHEHAAQGALMRAVVLMDYIRADTGAAVEVGQAPELKLGVVPVFDHVRRLRLPMLLPGILTGGLMVIPKTAVPRFLEVARELGIDVDAVSLQEQSSDGGVRLVAGETERKHLIRVITKLFEEGEVNCLVGTAALLGEGWDAPAVNTLILGSVIGSFVMSNQMRGRAMRSLASDPEKTANIWHLVTLSPAQGKEKDSLGSDFERLSRRFEAFHGIPLELGAGDAAYIEGGMNRLGLSDTICSDGVSALNETMLRMAEDRAAMARIWREAIPRDGSSRFLRPFRTVEIPAPRVQTGFSLRIAGGRKKGMRSWTAQFLERKRLSSICNALLAVAEDREIWLGEDGRLRVAMLPEGNFQVSVPGLSVIAQGQFADAVSEFFDLFTPSAYLIQQGKNGYMVPRLFGRSRAAAEQFSKALRKQGFGRNTPLSTDSHAGAGQLLLFRKKVLEGTLESSCETHVRWESAAR